MNLCCLAPSISLTFRPGPVDGPYVHPLRNTVCIIWDEHRSHTTGVLTLVLRQVLLSLYSEHNPQIPLGSAWTSVMTNLIAINLTKLWCPTV